MKIWFVPNYYYLSFPIYEQLICRLQETFDCCITEISGNIEVPYIGDDHKKIVAEKNINILKIPVRRVPDYRLGIIPMLRLIFYSISNYFLLREYLAKDKPDAVVVGSDLGNLNIRFLLGLCKVRNITVIIIYPADINFRNGVSDVKYDSLFYSRFYLRLPFAIFLRAFFFKGEVPGSFAMGSRVCVLSEESRERLVAKGVPGDLITVVGTMLNSVYKSREVILKNLGLEGERRVLTLFTECIQNLFGSGYAVNLYKGLKVIFDSLPTEVAVIIKIHPREDEEIRNLILGLFGGSRYTILTDFDTDELLSVTDLAIAHFSKVLITAVCLKKKILSINYLKDYNYTFIKPDESSLLEISSADEATDKIHAALDDPGYILRLKNKIYDISLRFDIMNADALASFLASNIKD